MHNIVYVCFEFKKTKKINEMLELVQPSFPFQQCAVTEVFSSQLVLQLPSHL